MRLLLLLNCTHVCFERRAWLQYTFASTLTCSSTRHLCSYSCIQCLRGLPHHPSPLPLPHPSPLPLPKRHASWPGPTAAGEKWVGSLPVWHGLIWDLLLSTYVCMCVEREGYSWFGTGSFLHVLLLMKKWVESLPLAYCYVRMCMCVEGERGLIICKSLYWQTSEQTRGGILSVFHLVQGSLFWQEEVLVPTGPSSVVARLGLSTLKTPPPSPFQTS